MTRICAVCPWGLVLALAWCLGVPSAGSACQIPVFRYALERWVPDPFKITIVHRDKLSDEQKAMIDQIDRSQHETKRPVNLALGQVIDANAPTKEQKAFLEKHPHESTRPWMFVQYPFWVRTDRLAYSGPFNRATLDNVIDSPARRQIVKRLIDGESAVWVLIESGHQAKDDQAYKTLVETMQLAKENLKLPIEEIKADKDYQADTKVKLQIAFSVIRLKRDNADEAFFLAHLLNSEPDLFKYADEPITLPIFGRGRSYFALVGKGLTQDNLADDAKFITSACSCTVKRENPGSDLVFAANWDNLIKGSAIPELKPPPIGGLLVPDAPDENASSAAIQAGPVLPPTSGSAATAATGPVIWMPVLAGVGLVIAAVFVGTLVIRSRQSRSI